MLNLKPDADLPSGLKQVLDRVERMMNRHGGHIVSRQIVALAIVLWEEGLD
jgi:class 3 adenylate cyclase